MNWEQGFLSFGVRDRLCGRLIIIFLVAFTAAASGQSSPTYRGVFTNHVVTVTWAGLCDRPGGFFQTNSYDQSSISIPFSRTPQSCTNRSLQGMLQLDFPPMTPDARITNPDTLRTINFTPALQRSASFNGQWQLSSEVAGNTLQIFDTLSLNEPGSFCTNATQNYGTGLASGSYPVMLTRACSTTNMAFPVSNGPDLVYQWATTLDVFLYAPSNPPSSRVLFLLSVDARTYYRVRTAAWIWANTNKLRFVVGATNPLPQTIQFTNTGTSNLIFSVSTMITNGGDWLSVVPNQGTLAPNQRTNLMVSVDGTQLSADLTNTASILISGNSTNSPQRIAVEAVHTNFVRLIGLEVNQVVQDWSNSIPLIAGKVTTVRAHLQSTGAQPARVTAKLRGFRNGSEILPSLDPSNPGGFIMAPTNAPDNRSMLRSMPNSSLNYSLPPTWTIGTIILQLETNGIACGEIAGVPNDCAVTVTFLPPVTPRLKFIAINWVTNRVTNATSPAQLEDLRPRLMSCFPIASVDFTTAEETSEVLAPPRTRTVLDHLAMIHRTDSTTMPGISNRIYYGAIAGDDVAGVAFTPGTEGCGYLPPTRFAEGRHTHSHEIGHSFGRDHAPFCGAEAGPATPTFPYIFALAGRNRPFLGPMLSGPDAIVYGYDHDAGQIVSPLNYFEMMSYCSRAPLDFWPSKFTYEALIPAISNRFAHVDPLPTAVPDNFTHFLARIDPVTDAVTFSPFVTVPGNFPPPPPAPGPYSLRLLNAAAQLIREIPFTPSIATPRGDAEPDLSFLVSAVANPNLHGVQVTHAGQVIATRNASANAPTVRVTFPNGGENLASDSITVTWTGADADGDPLTYMLQYSSDNGATWEALTADLSATSYNVPRRLLHGTSAGRLRVITSDGFLSGMDESDGSFTIANNAPGIAIRSPGTGRTFLGNDQIVLEALAYDREDGALDGTNVVWRSDLDGALGTGSRLYTSAAGLREGVHLLTASATDSSNAVGTAQVSVTVVRTNVANLADLAVSQMSEPTGDGVILTITLDNLGQANATSVRVTNQLPVGATVVAANLDVGTFSVTNSIISCNLPLLLANQTATLMVQLRLTASGIYTNIAEVRGAELDPNTANNFSQLVDQSITQPPSLAIERTENQITISWPATTLTNFVLQSSVNLLPAAWSDVAGTPTVANGRFQVNQNTTSITRYYRLIQR